MGLGGNSRSYFYITKVKVCLYSLIGEQNRVTAGLGYEEGTRGGPDSKKRSNAGTRPGPASMPT